MVQVIFIVVILTMIPVVHGAMLDLKKGNLNLGTVMFRNVQKLLQQVQQHRQLHRQQQKHRQQPRQLIRQ